MRPPPAQWRNRRCLADRATTPHTLATGFSIEEEEIAVELRTRLQLSLDDILEVVQRCLRPGHLPLGPASLPQTPWRLATAARPKPETRRFDPQPFGYVHVDLKHLTRLEGKPAYVFVAIERTTRFVHVEIVDERSGATIAACLEHFLQAFGHPVHTILTDNRSEFTDRFGAARWHQRERGTGNHPFDKLCQARGIRHKLTRPYRRQTNGMAERFNRRLGEALRQPSPPPPMPAKTASTITPSETHSSPHLRPPLQSHPIAMPQAQSTRRESSPISRDTTPSPGSLFS